jgi:diguanylate cyclase (GGDEF)-like protein
MVSNFYKIVWLVFLLSLSGSVTAQRIVSLTEQTPIALGKHLIYTPEQNKKLTLKQAIKQLKQSGLPSTKAMNNFGINARPMWLQFSINNPSKQNILRQIVIENSWLNQVDVYFVDQDKQIKLTAGDAFSFEKRKNQHRFLIFEHTFKPGMHNIYLRVESKDPMMLPIYLTTQNQTIQSTLKQGYYYGFIYGFLMALLAYNLVLFFSLRDKRYLFYVLYLTFFLLTNFSYTGYGFELLWPNSTFWQNVANPTLMLLYGLSGLLFTQTFLSTKQNLPKLHYVIKYTALIFIVLFILSLVFNQHVFMLLSAFLFTAIFPMLMLTLGIAAYKAGVPEAKFFLPATSIAMVSLIIITLTVWGYLPYNSITYHSIEIGMLIESVLFALALGEQFRIAQQQKIEAEFLSLIDPLTSLFNRRGFYRTTQGLFSNAKRQKREFSLLMLDLDDFKYINDNFGHNLGDSVLQETAKIIKQCSRLGDVPTRWGGEEFIIALPETNLKEAIAFAERLRVSITNVELGIKSKPICFTCSIGITSLNHEINNLDTLIAKADEKLYQAKKQGKNCVIG